MGVRLGMREGTTRSRESRLGPVVVFVVVFVLTVLTVAFRRAEDGALGQVGGQKFAEISVFQNWLVFGLRQVKMVVGSDCRPARRRRPLYSSMQRAIQPSNIRVFQPVERL